MKKNRYTYLLVLLISAFPFAFNYAQGVCNSSALLPVFSQTFGNGITSFSKSVVPPGFITNYTFNGSTALSDGQYIVTPLVENSQKNDWAIGRDHTGDSYGNMFLVNAGTGASLFFYQQVDNLCPGSVYSFSAWMANVNTISNTKSICGAGLVWPKVTFNIKNTSGVILQSFTTDTLPLTKDRIVAPNWQQYGFQFSLPSGTTSLILEMRDFYGGLPQCGNDLAIDDIVFSACTPTATAAFSTSSTLCAGAATSIDCSIINSPFSTPAYQWQKSTNNGVSWNNIGTPGTSATSYVFNSVVVADGAMYRVLVGPDVASLSSASCITASNAVTLTVNPAPSVTVSSASPICSGNILSIVSNASGGTSPYTYSWTGPNGFTSVLANPAIPNASIAAAGNYSLTITDDNNCIATDTKPIVVNATPIVAPITGNAGGCVGTSFSLANTTTGGVWSSNNITVATVSNTGTVSITGAGTSLVSYTVTSTGCSASATFTITGASVKLHPDVIECNNGISHFDATDSYYGVTYSNTDLGNVYAWTITGGPFSFQGSATATSIYPNVQLQTGYAYQTVIQFTTNGITCSDTQMVYKNVIAADTIQGSRDTTVCFNTSVVSVSGKASPVTNNFLWTTTGSGIFSNPNTLTTSYTLSAADKAAGIIKIYLTGSSSINATGNCGTNTSMDSMILRIYPDNAGSNSSVEICSNQTVHFTPSAAIPGSTFSWVSSIISGSVTGNTTNGSGTINDSLVNLSNTNNAVVIYTITPYAFTPSNIGCNGTPFTYTVTARPKPTVSITNSSASICTGSSTNIQFTSSIPGSMYIWVSSAIAGTITGNTSNAVASATNTITNILTNTSPTNAIVRYIITNTSPAGCSNIDSTDVLVYGASGLANAGPDQLLCNASASLLAAANPLLGSGTWSQLSGAGTVIFGSASSPSSTISGMSNGNYQLQWTVTNGSCSASSDTVVIVNTPPSVGGTLLGDATVCEGNNAGMLIVSGYTGSVIRWESSTDNGNTWNTLTSTNPTLTYTNITITTLYRAVVQNGNCGISNSSVATISVNPVSVAGTISGSATVCAANNNGTLTITGFTGSIVRWEFSSDNGINWSTIANTTANYDYTNLTTTSLFRAFVQSGSCGGAYTNSVTITVTPQTIPGILSADATVCATANSGSLSLTNVTGTILNWQSSTDNGLTWNTILNNTNTLSFTNLAVTTLFRASAQNGVCPALFSNNITITVLQPVTVANAGVDQTLCNATSASLSGNTPGSGTGIWAFVAGPTAVSIVNANDPSSVVSGLTNGSYQFVWMVENGYCASSKDTVHIIVDAPSNAGTLMGDTVVCAAKNSGIVSLVNYLGKIIRWEWSNDQGNHWNTRNDTTNSLQFTDIKESTWYRVLVQNNSCNSLYSNIVIVATYQASIGGKLTTVKNKVCETANTGIIQLHHFTGTITHWAFSTDNGNNWQIIPTTDSTISFNNLTVTTWYKVLVQNGNCSAIYSDTVVIYVDIATKAGTLTGNNTVCSTINNGWLFLSNGTGKVIHWEFSEDAGITWQTITNTSDSIQYQNLTLTTLYRVLVQQGTCASNYSNTVQIQVMAAVTKAIAGNDQLLCFGNSSVQLQANKAVSGKGIWHMASGPSTVILNDVYSEVTLVTGLQNGIYRFVWTISNGTCTNSTDTVVVTIDKVLSAFNLFSINDCGKTTYQFKNTSESVFGIKSYRWYTSSGDSISRKDASIEYTKDGQKDITLIVQSNSGCTNKTEANYQVVVYEYPKANIKAIADACKSQLLNVASEVSSKDSITYLLWNLGNEKRNKDSVITVQYMNDGNYTVGLTVATINRCYDSAFKQITVHPIPKVVTNSLPVICKGDSAVLSASGAMGYIWTDENNRIVCDGCSSTSIKPLFNSTYKVLGYNQYGCSEVKQVSVRVIQPFKMITPMGDTLCAGQNRQLVVKGASTYNWYPETGLSQTNTAITIAKPLTTTTYRVTGKDAFNCFTDTAEIKIVVGNPTRIRIGNDTVVTAGSTHQLLAMPETQNIRKWNWNGPVTFSCKTCPNPEIKIMNDASIYCLAVNIYGCTSIDTINIKTTCSATQVFIPNAFSPDGDGINDVLTVQGSGIKMVKSFRIFNRWGEVVFEKTNFLPGDPAYAWDGRIRGNPAPPDVFVYVCEVICEKGLPSLFKGNVAVLK